MKTPIAFFLLAHATPSLAGMMEVTQSQQVHQPGTTGWEVFGSASVAYLFDYRETMYSLNTGVRTPWNPLGWNTSLYVEIGLIEDDNESEIPFGLRDAPVDLQLVPITANLKFERKFTDSFGLYFGFGAGAIFSEIIINRDTRDQDVTFAAQVFGGASFHFGQHSELYAGGRWIYFDDTENFDLEQDWAMELGYRYHF